MNTALFIELVIGSILIGLGVNAILKEDKLIKFEKKAGRYIKAFFKALAYTLAGKSEAKELAVSKSVNNEYEEILASLEANKRYKDNITAIEDYLVA